MGETMTDNLRELSEKSIDNPTTTFIQDVTLGATTEKSVETYDFEKAATPQAILELLDERDDYELKLLDARRRYYDMIEERDRLRDALIYIRDRNYTGASFVAGNALNNKPYLTKEQALKNQEGE